MQSRFALTATKFSRTLFPAQRIRGCATTSGRTADPAVHAVEEEVRLFLQPTTES